MNSRMTAIPAASELAGSWRNSIRCNRNSPNGVTVLDHENRYVRVNHPLADFHGATAKKLAGHSPWEFLCDVPADPCKRLKQALEIGKPLLNVELSMKRAANFEAIGQLAARFQQCDRSDSRLAELAARGG